MVEALKRLWTDTCDISVRTAGKDIETGRTSFNENIIVSEEPCRVSFKLSFENASSAKEGGIYTAVNQPAKLFMDKAISVPAGSKITVTRDGQLFEFSRSGAPSLYDYHQEIKVEKFKGWA